MMRLNQFYCPALARDLLKKHIAILPFFMKTFSSIGITDPATWTKANNGAVERKNRDLKERVNTTGAKGNLSILTYMEKVRVMLFNQDFKRVLLEIPIKQGPRAQRKLDKNEDLTGLAQWRKPAPKGLFFDKEYIVDCIGKKKC